MSEQRYGYFKGCSASAKHRKNGSKSKKCSLPSDNMTQAQWKKRNGAVMEYRIDRPLKYEEFKRLPTDLRRKYIETLRSEHGASLTGIAEMLGVSTTTVYNRITRDLGITFGCGVPTAEERSKWSAFVGRSNEPTEETEQEPNEPEQESPGEAESSAERQSATMQMSSASISFVGIIDVNAIANSIRLILGDRATEAVVRINIEHPSICQ